MDRTETYMAPARWVKGIKRIMQTMISLDSECKRHNQRIINVINMGVTQNCMAVEGQVIGIKAVPYSAQV